MSERQKLLHELDHGPWSLIAGKNGKVGVISDDFTHDVVLWVDGDFGSDEKRIEYARALARTLNEVDELGVGRARD